MKIITPKIDTGRVEAHLRDFIRKTVEETGASSLVIGVSGGLDSAAAAFLTRNAVGENGIRALILPYRDRNAEDVEDAREVCRRLKIRPRVIDIGPTVDAYFSLYPDAAAGRRGNKMARERMSVLYDWAAEEGGLVLGTSNRTELLLGYFTKYGDGAADLEPLGGLYKCEVRQLASSLGVPETILNKTPSAGLWKGQTDEEEIGISYPILDGLLHAWLDLGWDRERLLEAGFSPENVDRVRSMVRGSEHKRRPPPLPEIPPPGRKTEPGSD